MLVHLNFLGAKAWPHFCAPELNAYKVWQISNVINRIHLYTACITN